MVKVKHQRTADCVVAGFRTHKDGAGVGSLLLGLFDPAGMLHHVGVASGFSVARRRELVAELEPYRKHARKDHPWAGWAEAQAAGRAPGGTNRWNAGKDMTWEPVRPEAVCEVSYDHLQQDRFRHATSFVRWRPDRDPASCTYAQLDTPVPMELNEVFGTSGPRTRGRCAGRGVVVARSGSLLRPRRAVRGGAVVSVTPTRRAVVEKRVAFMAAPIVGRGGVLGHAPQRRSRPGTGHVTGQESTCFSPSHVRGPRFMTAAIASVIAMSRHEPRQRAPMVAWGGSMLSGCARCR